MSASRNPEHSRKRAFPETRRIAIANERLTLELWPYKGACLLFYPGTMIEPGHYRLFLNELSWAGFSVCALHLPGHGANRQKVSTFEDFTCLGLLAEDWLRNELRQPVAVCGHSQGGILAMAHASQSRNAAACLPISAALPELEQAIGITRFKKFAPWRSQILNTLRKGASILPGLPVPLPFYLSARRILAGRKKPSFTGNGKSRFCYPLKFLYSLFSARIPTPIKVPLWLYSARNDALFNPDLVIESFVKARPPAGEIVWLPEGGHMCLFNPFLANFVAKSCASHAAGLGLCIDAA